MGSTRREFLEQSAKILATGLVGGSVLNTVKPGQVLAAATERPTTQPADTREEVERRPLGRTGLKVSVISVGSIGTSENVVRYALGRGINFIHVSIDYGGGKAIREVAKAIKGTKPRDVHLGLKVVWNLKSDGTLDKALKILGREYVDVIFFQIHNRPKETQSPEVKEAFERWKKQGKVRFMGLTTHGGMKECMEAALETGWYDCLMPRYTLSMREEFLDIFKKCEKQKVGFIAMKTEISENNVAPIPILLKDPVMTTLCKSLRSLDAVKKYLAAAKEKPSETDVAKTQAMASRIAVGRCRMCGTCTRTCPAGVAVSDIVRCVDYYVDTDRNYEFGLETYRALASGQRADRCEDCGACERACPRRVPIRHYLRRSKEMFA